MLLKVVIKSKKVIVVVVFRLNLVGQIKINGYLLKNLLKVI